jgi:hypothetical protein
MNISPSSFQAQSLTSIKQALQLSVLQKAMKQDPASMENLVKAMEQSVAPHLGQNIDIKL